MLIEVGDNLEPFQNQFTNDQMVDELSQQLGESFRIEEELPKCDEDLSKIQRLPSKKEENPFLKPNLRKRDSDTEFEIMQPVIGKKIKGEKS